MLCVSDCIADRIRLAIPQPTKWERIGDQINAAFIVTRSDFVKVFDCLNSRIIFRRLRWSVLAVVASDPPAVPASWTTRLRSLTLGFERNDTNGVFSPCETYVHARSCEHE